MIAATDFRGRPGRDADIVARGSRLDEGNYAEIELHRFDYWQKTDSTTRVVATLAFASPVFHYNGEFKANLAVRNLYIEERDLGLKGLSIWAGSRMYRGDDIYLLDYWPLDNLNTMGGGARYDIREHTFVAFHAGANQPRTPFFLQQVDRPAALNQLGATKVEILNRQRIIASLKASHIIWLGGGAGLKLVGYGEFHHLPAGQRETIPQKFEDVPSDIGYVGGAQVTLFSGERSTHLNLYFKYAGGLAAYGELGSPTQLGLDKSASRAREIVVALGGNYEVGPFGLLAGAYYRSFRDASPLLDAGDLNEGVVVLRPQVFFGEIGGIGVEGSYQAQQRAALPLPTEDQNGTTPITSGPISPNLFRIGVIPFLSPAGRGSFSRPQFRLIYTATFRNEAARQLYAKDDAFSLHKVEHFFGFGAEWWFNSSSYAR